MSTLSLGWLIFSMQGCPRPPLQASMGPAPSCPTPALDVPADCTPATGTLEAPLEWGIGADSDNQLWLGRLACADGSMPSTRRLEGQRAQALPTAAPRSNVPLPTTGLETVSVWSVRCPSSTEEHLWVVNPYRCGDLCPPEGFKLLPSSAALALEEARLGMIAEDLSQVSSSLQAAVQAAPDFEVTHFTQAATWMTLDQSERALSAFEAAAAINPDNVSNIYAQIILLRSLNRAPDSHALSFRLLELTPPTHPQHPPALCMAALAHHEQDNHGRAHALAAEACAQGFSLCCSLPAN